MTQPEQGSEAFSSSVIIDQTQTVAAPETLLASADMPPQSQITQEIIDLHAEANAREEAGESVPSTLYDFPPYRSSILRHPTKNPRLVDPESIELWSPAYGQRDVAAIVSPEMSTIFEVSLRVLETTTNWFWQARILTARPAAKADGNSTISAPASRRCRQPSDHSMSKQTCAPTRPKSV